MRPPNRVQVGPYSFTIDFDPITHNSVEIAEGEKLYGRVDFPSQTINVNPGQEKDSLADTILHEILHAVIYISGLQKRFEGNSEEELITPMATTLLDTLRRNPKLVDFLVGREAPKRRKAAKFEVTLERDDVPAGYSVKVPE